VFDEVLRHVLDQVEGASCVLLAGRDGVVVAAAVRDGGPSPEAIAAAMSELLRRADSASRDAELGSTGELTVGGAAGHVVLREVASGYLLAAALAPHAILGRARFELRKAAMILHPELV
jgi:predicted regulator of Ras-like GTPase activity (Roadblock/LC7/MglB family)